MWERYLHASLAFRQSKKIGLRGRISPICTLSQNGYGDGMRGSIHENHDLSNTTVACTLGVGVSNEGSIQQTSMTYACVQCGSLNQVSQL